MTIPQEQVKELEKKMYEAAGQVGFDHFVEIITTVLGFNLVYQKQIFLIIMNKGQNKYLSGLYLKHWAGILKKK